MSSLPPTRESDSQLGFTRRGPNIQQLTCSIASGSVDIARNCSQQFPAVSSDVGRFLVLPDAVGQFRAKPETARNGQKKLRKPPKLHETGPS
eukprot:12224264-Alexandrium_andersonii.AAC.1